MYARTLSSDKVCSGDGQIGDYNRSDLHGHSPHLVEDILNPEGCGAARSAHSFVDAADV